ncbi:c-type cytochrome [Algoriphagus namhaensis]|uniref:C-type cytochrome n=1 Tax=Algoriphagus namhaensis TaxID=915353 RepID=A0ABV8APJ1_9BACT
MRIILTLSLAFIHFGAWNFVPSEEESQKLDLIQVDQVEEGLLLLQKHCYTCHNPKSKSHDEIPAPPLWGMKKHYLEAYPEQTEFEKAMMTFILNPNEEKALMKGPIKRFGLMPKPQITEEEAKKIVRYIYEQELENPLWHQKKEGGKIN